jgi:hypothetical protein
LGPLFLRARAFFFASPRVGDIACASNPRISYFSSDVSGRQLPVRLLRV